MNDKELISELIRRSNSDNCYFQYAYIIARLLPKNLHEHLKQLVNGPVWDGDVISKAGRDELLSYRLAVRVCCRGEQGYTGATYLAYTVNKNIEEIKAGKIG